MTQGIPKLQGVFYPLQHEEWLRAYCELTTRKQAAFYCPEHQKRIHWFGECIPEKAALIKSGCSEFQVNITFEETES
ncbi:hypothetical protein Cylst_6586 (plasmid) [Cylindrospermum stagnale PCC 7417]|uniref:Uncharacterized protein n=1 Tax=Cylindrospermum stagnale PCC 7417 TaxID=56107 RepID=K9X9M4_9NOST|nr:hypothetical protein [Cylindrospermum stagnale]AFZ28357.1 hypothetical protein Cylst_6586 [Cylindrospermum stagnale PCC 7417]